MAVQKPRTARIRWTSTRSTVHPERRSAQFLLQAYSEKRTACPVSSRTFRRLRSEESSDLGGKFEQTRKTPGIFRWDQRMKEPVCSGPPSAVGLRPIRRHFA